MNLIEQTVKYQPKEIKYTINRIKEKDDCVILYLNNERLTISIEDYFKYGFNSLNGLDDYLYDLLKKQEKILLAYNGCLRKLAIREHSIKQINNYVLSKFALSEDDLKDLLNKLQSYGLLDENRYANSLISKGNNEGKSYQAIKSKMITDGLNNEIIEECLIYDYDNELNKAINIANKANLAIKNKTSAFKKSSILNRLVSLGFSYEISKNALNEITIICDNESVLLNKEYQKALKKYQRKFASYDLKNHIFAYLKQKGFKNEDINLILEDLNG